MGIIVFGMFSKMTEKSISSFYKIPCRYSKKMVAASFFSACSGGIAYQHFKAQSELDKEGRFNLQNHIPKSKHARQVLLENPGQRFIGVYNVETDEITLMPCATLEGNYLTFYYGLTGIYKIKQTKTEYDEYNSSSWNVEVELDGQEFQEMIEKCHLFIPRFAEFSKAVAYQHVLSSTQTYNSHETMLFYNMGIKTIKSYYGFSVMLDVDGYVTVCGLSQSLNKDKPGTRGREMSPVIKRKIEQTINQWIPKESAPVYSAC